MARAATGREQLMMKSLEILPVDRPPYRTYPVLSRVPEAGGLDRRAREGAHNLTEDL